MEIKKSAKIYFKCDIFYVFSPFNTKYLTTMKRKLLLAVCLLFSTFVIFPTLAQKASVIPKTPQKLPERESKAVTSVGEFASGFRLSDGVFYNTTGAGVNLILGTTFANNQNIGNFNANCLSITAGEVKTWFNGNDVTTSARMYWRLSSGSFTTVPLTNRYWCNSGTFSDGDGPCGGDDRKFKDWNLNIPISNGLSAGTYTLEVYFQITGSYPRSNCNANCDEGVGFTGSFTSDVGGAGNPYKIQFTIQDIVATATTSTPSICSGQTINLGSTVTGVVGGGETYSWTGPNGFTSSSATPSISSASTSASGTYTLNVTKCGVTKTSTVDVLVKATPTAAPGFTCNNTTKSVDLTATTVSGATYQWTGPDGYSSTTQNPSLPYTVSATATKAGTYTLTVTNDGCSSTAVGVNVSCSALPVNLTGFSATTVDEKVKLDWETASETNNAYFEIERSADVKSFAKIGQVAGQINSSALIQYSFIDEQPQSGINYYRLRQVDLDGKFEYSKIRSAIVENGITINISPNPTDDYIVLRGLPENSSFEIVDLNGSNKYQKLVKDNAAEHRVNVSQYGSGLYIVRITSGDKVEVRKFFIN